MKEPHVCSGTAVIDKSSDRVTFISCKCFTGTWKGFIDGSKDFVYISKLLIEIEESLGFKGVVMLFPEAARFLG